MKKKTFTKLFILTTMLLGLPILGVTLANKPITPYLEFPPQTFHVRHAAFSWPVFVGYCLFILAVVTPLFVHGMRSLGTEKNAPSPTLPFPWWGWFGIVLGIMAWVLAWTRFQWFGKFQAHSFTPLWIGYIITINALTYRRAGHCMLRDRPGSFLLLFPASAAFWWFFEYLNRFVQNWYYVGAHFDPLEYFLYATLPFSAVLPAVMGTREWVLGFSWPEKKFKNFLPMTVSHPRLVAWTVLLITGIGLAGIGVWPNHLFPLLWISPLMIIVSLQIIFKEPHLFSDVAFGDWRYILSSALAALICGFFWEMWNYHSLAKWKYSIPFVHHFQIFEMPILGYAGYLPFGVECAVIADMVMINRGK
ncbi:MAG: hypothetical protein V3W19_13855 [Desulfatiglandales bacterium]